MPTDDREPRSKAVPVFFVVGGALILLAVAVTVVVVLKPGSGGGGVYFNPCATTLVPVGGIAVPAQGTVDENGNPVTAGTKCTHNPRGNGGEIAADPYASCGGGLFGSGGNCFTIYETGTGFCRCECR